LSGTTCVVPGSINGWIIEDAGQCPIGGGIVSGNTCQFYSDSGGYIDLVYPGGGVDRCTGNEPYGYNATAENGSNYMISYPDGHFYCGSLGSDPDTGAGIIYYYANKRFSLSYSNPSYAASATPTYGTGVVGAATPVYGTAVSPTSYTPDAGQITGISCNNTSPVIGSNINCTVIGTGAPSGIPYGGSVTLSVDNGGGTSTCTFTGSATATCTPVSVGSTPGAKTVTTSSGGTLGITVIKVNFGKVDWIFNPDQGGTSPLFRSQDNTSIKVNNFRTSTDLTPTSNTRYTCTFEYRNLNDRLTSTPTWTALNTTPLPYTTTSGTTQGCTVNLTKTQRANTLNHSLRLTIADTTVSNPSTTNPNTYLFYNEYIYRFQGAGVASGG
jgi:hypothetical protein